MAAFSEIFSNFDGGFQGWVSAGEKYIADLSRREKAVMEKEADLASREKDVFQKESELAAREENIIAKEAELAERESAIEARSLEISGREADATTKEKDAIKKEADLSHRERNLAERILLEDDVFAEREQKMGDLYEASDALARAALALRHQMKTIAPTRLLLVPQPDAPAGEDRPVPVVYDEGPHGPVVQVAVEAEAAAQAEPVVEDIPEVAAEAEATEPIVEREFVVQASEESIPQTVVADPLLQLVATDDMPAEQQDTSEPTVEAVVEIIKPLVEAEVVEQVILNVDPEADIEPVAEVSITGIPAEVLKDLARVYASGDEDLMEECATRVGTAASLLDDPEVSQLSDAAHS